MRFSSPKQYTTNLFSRGTCLEKIYCTVSPSKGIRNYHGARVRFLANRPDVGTGCSSGSFRSVWVGKECPPCQLASPLPSRLGTTTPAWRTTGGAFRLLPCCGVSYGRPRLVGFCQSITCTTYAVRTQAAVSTTELYEPVIVPKVLAVQVCCIRLRSRHNRIVSGSAAPKSILLFSVGARDTEVILISCCGGY